MRSNIQEQQTVPLMPNMDDKIYITFDKQQRMPTWMCVFRKINNDVHMINRIDGKEAEDLYKKLVDWDNMK